MQKEKIEIIGESPPLYFVKSLLNKSFLRRNGGKI